jgi:putative membrane-bound dehydrogenase-like protein
MQSLRTTCVSLKSLSAFLAAMLTASCGGGGPPYGPMDALKTFSLPDGFRIELVAAEPEVRDPVAMTFDDRGRIYVVEMGDYPISNERLSRVKLLEDRDGDGRYEHSSIFVDNLHFAHGVMPWKRGILVTNAPHVVYYEDRDNNGKADFEQVILTGFAQVNPQLRVNAPTYGLDNWIYAAYPKFGRGQRFVQFSDLGRPIHFPSHPEASAVDVFLKGMDLRFKPDQLKLEAVSGNSEFGLAFDSAGNRFPSWNDKHAQHVVIENRYLSRNPHLAVGTAVAQISDHGSAAEIYPVTDDSYRREIRSTQNMSQLGHFTSACGQTIYNGGNFPTRYKGAYFICEPVSNLVHCDLLTPNGATFVAKRDRENTEFLASRDSWFMPVFTTVGPDGALYVVDFYRKIVEHPEWIRKEYVSDEKLFYAGNDKGRIYRIVHSSTPVSKKPKLNEATPQQLVQELSNSNLWWRVNAQRLLVERQSQDVIPALLDVVANGSTQGKVHALWTLEGVGQLNSGLVLRALKDREPAVRLQALRLAEGYLNDSSIKNELLNMKDEPDIRVEFQLACTLGELPNRQSFESLRQIASRRLADPWFQIAVLSASNQNPVEWLEAVLSEKRFTQADVKSRGQFLRQISSIIGAKQHEREISKAAMVASNIVGDQRKTLLDGLAEGLKRGSKAKVRVGSAVQNQILKLVESPDGLGEAAFNVASCLDLTRSPQLDALMKHAREIAAARNGKSEARVAAVRILGLDPTHSGSHVLRELLVPQESEQVQMAVVRALVASADSTSIDILLDKWQIYSGAQREIVLENLLRQSKPRDALLQAIEAGKVQPWSLSRARRNQLLRSTDEGVRKRAEALFSGFSNDRESVIEKYRSAITTIGKAERGEEVFKKKCARCHKIGGIEVGPDLLTITKWDKESLLANILDPSASIASGFEEYVVELRDGTRVTGVMAQESETTVTLRRSRGEEDTVLRSKIVNLRSGTVSAMPDGIEDEIPLKEMIDLLEYLQGLKGSVKNQADSGKVGSR